MTKARMKLKAKSSSPNTSQRRRSGRVPLERSIQVREFLKIAISIVSNEKFALKLVKKR